MAKKPAKKKKDFGLSPAPAEPEAGGAEDMEDMDTRKVGRLTWKQTGWLLAGGWGALAIFAGLWRLWTGRPLIVYFAAGAIGVCYTLAVLFDRFREE